MHPGLAPMNVSRSLPLEAVEAASHGALERRNRAGEIKASFAVVNRFCWKEVRAFVI